MSQGPGSWEAYCCNANQMFQSIQWMCIHVSRGVGGKEKVIKVSGPAAAWHDEMCFNKEKKNKQKKNRKMAETKAQSMW